MERHPLIGLEFGNYIAESVLGEGAMGLVLSCRHKFLGTRAAVKLLHGTYAGNPNVAQRFFQEAKATIGIEHPGVVKVLDFGQTARGELYLVMEQLDGHSLACHLEAAAGPLRESQTARIGAAIADALVATHARGVVHRDLKPDNVMVLGEGIKLLDFGIAKVLSDTPSATRSGALLGTPLYMAPEQALGKRTVGSPADVYALGVMLFEMATGRVPFIADNLIALASMHIEDPPPAPRTFAALSPALESLILDCLGKDPTCRPPVNAVRDRLGRLIEGLTGTSADDWRDLETVIVKRESLVAATAPPTRSSPSTLSGASGELAGRPRRRSVAIAALVIGAALGSGAVLFSKLRASPEPGLSPAKTSASAPPAVPPEPPKQDAPEPAPVSPTVEVKPAPAVRASSKRTTRASLSKAEPEVVPGDLIAPASGTSPSPRQSSSPPRPPTLVDEDEEKRPAPEVLERGYLIANTQPWSAVFVDGKDTGRTTPITPKAKLALTPGRHSVTFLANGRRYTFEIEIRAGEDTKMIRALSPNEITDPFGPDERGSAGP